MQNSDMADENECLNENGTVPPPPPFFFLFFFSLCDYTDSICCVAAVSPWGEHCCQCPYSKQFK